MTTREEPTTSDPTASPRGGNRHRHRAGLYAYVIATVVLAGVLIAWVLANRDPVRVEWLVASTEAALALVIFIAAALGWLLGIATAIVIRRRTRAGG